MERDFTWSTVKALNHSDEPVLRDMKLSIPLAILQKIETRRSELIHEAVGVCQPWFNKFCAAFECVQDAKQSFEGGSMVLGALTRPMNNMGILSPQTSTPYAGLSLARLQRSVNLMKTPVWHIPLERRSYGPEYQKS
ncbi:hypothetical protein G6011_08612 [Alternaria panax]|uniref:Uncharacterized protein n=1 Tax=Alternaria panax TaxID=48097 RepID=A0AAD4FH83_9PLEO|nr:hypothetical protein G6011_08612 [Alternaria panax]